MQQVVRAEHTGLIGSQPSRSPLADVSETKIVNRGQGFPVGWLIAPATLWLFIFLVIPLAGIIVFSFWQSTRSGMVPDFTFKYYGEYFISEGFLDPSSGKFLTPSATSVPCVPR
mgnify:CR=1 FL=1